MQDNTFDDETIAIGIAHIARHIPRPQPSHPLPVSGQNRLNLADLSLLLTRLNEIGVGPILVDQLFLCSPDLADDILEALGVLEPGELAIASCYSSLGQVNAMTTGGKDILIDPLTGIAQVIEAKVESPLFLQMDIANQIASAIDEAKEPDNLVDLEGRNLFRSLRKELGPLSLGECYASERHIEDPKKFTLNEYKIAPVADFILGLIASGKIEISKLDGSVPTSDDSAWGDDWGE